MNCKNLGNIFSGLLTFLIVFTTIAWSEGEKMNSLTLEDLFKYNTFVRRVPIDITDDGDWIAYNTQNREQYEGGDGNSAYSKTGVMIEMAYATVWVTNTRTGEHRNLTPDWGSSWAPRWSPDGTRLAFYSDRMGKPHLYVWNRESDDMQVFSTETVQTFFGFEVPKWTPDGRFVLIKSIPTKDPSNDEESVQDKSQILPKTSPEPSFVEVWDWPKRQLQKQKDESTQENEQSKEKERGRGNKVLVIADTKTGKTLPLMKGYRIRSFDIDPNAEYVAVTVSLGVETLDAQQQIFDLYVIPLLNGVSDASSTEIEPIARKIRFAYGITVSWSPNSKYIAWTTGGEGGKLASGNAYVIDVDMGIVRNLTEDLDIDLGRMYQPPLWVGESDALLCIANGKIWRVPMNGDAIRNLTKKFEFSVHDVFYQSEGYTPWIVDNAIIIRASHSFYRLSLTDDTITLLHKDEQWNGHTGRFRQDVAEKTGECVYVVESSQEPPNIWMNEATFESPRQITDVNPHLKTIDFGRSELIEWTLEDGQTVKGILALPPEASEQEPVPMIVNAYAGGTHSSKINTFALGENVGGAHPGMFLSRGYALFLPDFPVQKIEPYKQFSDIVLPGIDAAIATKKVDAKRLGVIGHSFGGYTVNVLITQTTRFKAAVAAASIGNLISGYLTSGLGTGWHEAGQAGMGGSLWEVPQRYIDGSPIIHLDKVETPLLLIHGDQDFIPFEQAKEMFMGLAHLEKEVVLLKYREADHWPGFWSNEKLADYWKRVLNWFDEYLK